MASAWCALLCHLVDKGEKLPWCICHHLCSHVEPPAAVQALCGGRREQNSADRRRANPQKGHCGPDRAAECPSRLAGNRHHYQWHCPQAQAARSAGTRCCPISWHTVIFWLLTCRAVETTVSPCWPVCSNTCSIWGCMQTCNQHISVMHLTNTALHNAAKRGAHDCCSMQTLLCMHQDCKQRSCMCCDRLMCELG